MMIYLSRFFKSKINACCLAIVFLFSMEYSLAIEPNALESLMRVRASRPIVEIVRKLRRSITQEQRDSALNQLALLKNSTPYYLPHLLSQKEFEDLAAYIRLHKIPISEEMKKVLKLSHVLI